MTFIARHISVSINCRAARVYDFASDPKNLPKWAAGLSGSIRKVGRDWIAQSPMGMVKIKFSPKNRVGILDHDVTLPSGEKVRNPMRVFPNNDGSEVVFTSTGGRAGQTGCSPKMPTLSQKTYKR